MKNLARRRRRRPAPAFVNVLDTFLNEGFLKNLDEGLSVWNGTAPAVNVKEDADAFSIEVAAPGYEKNDFVVTVEDNVLLISAAIEDAKEATAETTETKEETYTRREFKYGSFKRSFNLPETVDATKIGAAYINGILTVSVPKKEEAKPLPARTIEIG